MNVPESKPQDVHIEHQEQHDRDSFDLDEKAKQLAELDAHYASEPQLKSTLDLLSTSQTLRVFWKASLVCLIVSFSAMCDGYQVNLNGSIVANTGFIKQFATKQTAKGAPMLDPRYVSAWGGMQSVGQVIAMVSLTYFGDKLGRKKTLYGIWVFMAVSVLVETLAKKPWAWLIAKMLAGIGVGGMQATLPMYISEISPVNIRGVLINSYSLWFVFGQLLAPIVLDQMHLHSPTDFRTPILTQWAMIGALIIFWVPMPESPWWLVQKGRKADAAKVLQKLNGDIKGYSVEAEANIIEQTIEHERAFAEENNQLSYWQIFKGTDGWRLLIACFPKIMQQVTGLSVVNSYSTYFFQLAGNKDPFRVTVILACVQMISIIILSVVTDVRRRPIVVYGFGLCALSLLAIGVIGCFDYASYSLGSLLIFFACLAIFSNTAAGAVGYALVAEVPSQRLRARTSGFGLAIAASFGVCFSFSVPIMLKGAPKWGIKTGFFFAATGIPASIIAWFIIPETARRSPAELDEMFTKKVPSRKFRTFVTEVETKARERAVDEGAA